MIDSISALHRNNNVSVTDTNQEGHENKKWMFYR